MAIANASEIVVITQIMTTRPAGRNALPISRLPGSRRAPRHRRRRSSPQEFLVGGHPLTGHVFANSGLDPSEYALPVSSPVLAEKPHRRIPGSVAPIQQPPPVGNEGQRDPDGNAQGPGQVGYRRIAGDHQVQIHQHGSRVHEVLQTAAQFRDRKAVAHLLQLLRARPFCRLKKWTPGKPASGSKQLSGRERAWSLRCIGLPCQAMPILKPAMPPSSCRQCSDQPRVGEEVGNIRGYRFQGRVEDAGQAQQRGVHVEGRKIGSPPDQTDRRRGSLPASRSSGS